ncbi:MAG: DUF1761 domain-containing protein [Candidatus Aminicenantes bacterium]|nr:DUF1761 domain-containing protein [Candidatus Aminicenantes bacterium]
MNLNFFGGLNVLSILVCGAVSLVLGFLWYGPLFGKAWAGYTGWTEEKVKTIPGSRMAMTYALTFLAALVSAYVLAVLSPAVGASTAADGLVLGLAAGVGFVAMAFGTTHLFEHKPLRLWLIVAGYEIVYLAAAGVVVTVWR